MDAPRRLTDGEADHKLRDLFAQVGALQAPEDLESRVLRRVAQTTAPYAADEPLISNEAWFTLGALLLGLILYGLLTPFAEGPSGSTYQQLLPDLTLPDLGKLLRSPWMLMGLACTAAFLSLEAYLFRPKAMRVAR
ncbi:MAG: hypothetical protein IT229_07590 [Flavobacteriales bacterium]|nr:hypothetical protein [Flavobacteriales bacterium]